MMNGAEVGVGPVALVETVLLAGTSLGVLVLLLLLAILASLAIGSLPAWQRFGAGFLTREAWNPVTEDFEVSVLGEAAAGGAS